VFTKQGTGPRPQPGDLMVIHGIGRFPDGKEFWNTRTAGVVYEYTPGVDRVIRGFEEGMRDVREGGRQQCQPPAGRRRREGASNGLRSASSVASHHQLLSRTCAFATVRMCPDDRSCRGAAGGTLST
jgi:FKBP-type peptidyl-prolyl cis-trans isomerase